MNYKKEEADNLLQKLGIVLKPEDKDKDGKALLKVSLDTTNYDDRSYQNSFGIYNDECFIIFLTSLPIHNERTK